jgi:hypothetical protein
MDVDLRTIVATEARRLDVIRPGWAAEIYRDSLRMDSCFFCVLGQLFGTDERGLDAVHPDSPSGVRQAAMSAYYPISARSRAEGRPGGLEPELRHLWLAEVGSRLAEPAS